jgi:hypothetical protein
VQAILAQALPGKIPAAGAGQATILAISIMDSTTGGGVRASSSR